MSRKFSILISGEVDDDGNEFRVAEKEVELLAARFNLDTKEQEGHGSY